MEVLLLGELAVVADDGSPLPVRGAKQRALLALLALHRGEPVSAERLIDALWGDDPPGNPTNALQALIANLRRALGSDAIGRTDAGYSLAVDADDIDVVRFEGLVAHGRHALAVGDPSTAADEFAAAHRLRRGDPLVEFAFAEFADGERARLDELVVVAAEGQAEARLELGHHHELVGDLEALCLEHPLRERLWELLMLALYRAGRQANALRAFGEARERLVEELGIEPGPALRDLERRILAQDPSLDLPAERSIEGPRAPTAGNLRDRLTSFVGREDDIEAIRTSLDSHRLVTLIGPGGSGKTSLALEVATRVQPEMRDGAWLIELAGVRDAEGVAPAMYAALRVGETATSDPEGRAAPVPELIVRHLQGRSMVVVLDNCEHVIAEAAILAEALSSRLPDLRVLATSREALGVPGEMLIAVGGLDLDAAVVMFRDRAQSVRADFEVDESNRDLVVDICRRLDGLPLALELAAARLRALPLPQLATRLDDRFRVLTGGARTALPRQQTLRAVVDWSYDLLFDAERRVFERLAVFTGGCELEAAENICSDDVIAPDEVCDLLLHLVDKSLVIADVDGAESARYTQLQTLWQYGRERLAEAKDAASFRDRHAQWYLDLASNARMGLRGGTGLVWRARVDADHDNLRGALDWFAGNGDAASALTLVDGIAWAWFLGNDPHEAVRWLGDALAVGGDAPNEVRAMVVAWSAYFGAQLFGSDHRRDELEAAVAELRSGNDRQRLADSLLILGELRNRANDADLSQAAVDEVRPIVAELDDHWGLAVCDSLTSRNFALNGDLDAAADVARASIARHKSIGEEWLVLEGLGILAVLSEMRGDLDGAGEAYAELMMRGRTLNVPLYETQWTMRLGALRARQGDDDEAERLFRLFLAGDSIPSVRGWTLIALAGVQRRKGELDEARASLDQALALYESLSLDPGCAAALTGLGWWAIGAGDLDSAAAFAEQAHAQVNESTDLPIAVAVDTLAATVTLVRTGTPEARAAFDAVLDRRASAPGFYVMVAGGPMGAPLDEPDVVSFVASH